MKQTSIYIEQCKDLPPVNTASFYDRSADLVFVETELHIPGTPPYECFTAGYWVVFKTDNQVFMSYVEIIVPQAEWEVEKNIQPPPVYDSHQVIFHSPRRDGKPRIRYVTNPSKDLLYIHLRARKAKYHIRTGSTLLLEVAPDLELVGLWILDIAPIESDELTQKFLSGNYATMRA
jgi:hypothetical protein